MTQTFNNTHLNPDDSEDMIIYFQTLNDTLSVDWFMEHLFVFFGHPLVPAVQHLQPFCFPLPQHLSWDHFSTGNIRQIRNQIIFRKTKNSWTVPCAVMTGAVKRLISSLYIQDIFFYKQLKTCHQSELEGKQEAVGELSPNSTNYSLGQRDILLHSCFKENTSCVLDTHRTQTWFSEQNIYILHHYSSWTTT